MIKGNWAKIWNGLVKTTERKRARIAFDISLGLKKLFGNHNKPKVAISDDQ